MRQNHRILAEVSVEIMRNHGLNQNLALIAMDDSHTIFRKIIVLS
jgi:hypothetical protein